jgi:chromosome partitioning protein
MTTLLTQRGKAKEFDFVNVLLAKVETGLSAIAVREWITSAYAEKVLPVEIPVTSATSGASVSFGTVYDTNATEIGARTYKRAFDAYEKFVELIEGQIEIAWARQLNDIAKRDTDVDVKNK